MDFTSRYPIRQLTVLAQDPGVLQDGKAVTITVPVPDETLTPGPKGHRIHVVDFDSSENRYYAPRRDARDDPYMGVTDIDRLVNDRDFHAQNAYGHVATTLAQFEAALGRHVNWSFPSGAHHIKVSPHAFLDPNAFYSRRDEALCFGYFPKIEKPAKADDYVYTCLSADIVTHETTHAILDGLRRELMRPSTPDQPGFHEGFADIVALLSSLSRDALLQIVLPVTRRGGRTIIATSELTPAKLRQSVLLGLAKEFGKTLEAQNMLHRGATALRRSVEMAANGKNYEPLLQSGSEAHELGEVIVAAAMNAFLEIWQARTRTLDPTGSGFADRDRVIEDGTKAAQDLLHMMIRALDYLPPVNMTYRDFLSALLTADRELVPQGGKYNYRQCVLDAFARYGITPATKSGCWEPPVMASKIAYGFSGHAEMMWDREAIMRFIWENQDPLEVDCDALTSVNFVKPSVRTGPDGFLLRETVVEYMQLLDVTGGDLKSLKLRKPDDMPDDTPVRLMGGGTLVFDDYGLLKFHIGSGVLSQKQNYHVKALWQENPDAAIRRFEVMHLKRILGGMTPGKAGW